LNFYENGPSVNRERTLLLSACMKAYPSVKRYF
jgi:hypothetical protein